jgi:hypothetical protein
VVWSYGQEVVWGSQETWNVVAVSALRVTFRGLRMLGTLL